MFIPSNIGHLHLAKLQASQELRRALAKLQIRRLIDLHGMSKKDLNKAHISPLLLRELDVLIDGLKNNHATSTDSPPHIPTQESATTPPSAAPAPLVPPSDIPADPQANYIFIPVDMRGMPLAQLHASVRLHHIFEFKGFKLLGELHGLRLSDFRHFRNCGKKTVQELYGLVKGIQGGTKQPESLLNPTLPEASPPNVLRVRQNAADLDPSHLPLSVRAENILLKLRVKRLADLDGISTSEVLDIDNCGKKTLAEIQALLRRANNGEFDSNPIALTHLRPADLLLQIDSLLLQLRKRNLEFLLLRLGGDGQAPRTLEAIASRSDLTRERVRQVVHKLLEQLTRAAGPKGRALLDAVAKICHDKVCPLTPDWLKMWVSVPWTFRFDPSFYTRLIGQIRTDIPAWPEGQKPSGRKDKRLQAITAALESVLLTDLSKQDSAKALDTIHAIRGFKKVTPGDLLLSLKQSRHLQVTFPQPDRPIIHLKSLRAAHVAKVILQASDIPLTPEDILARAKERFGPDLVCWTPFGMANSLLLQGGFHLLGPRSYGLRQHLGLPERQWSTVREDCRRMLTKQNRPVSTSEVVNNAMFSWTRETNAYELAAVLREDASFIDLGKFLFALAEWGIAERTYIKDLIPKVLKDIGRPATALEVFKGLQQLRSVSPTSMSQLLRSTPGVQNYGFGHFGLIAWGDKAKTFLVSSVSFVERIVRRADPPLRFGHIAEILTLPFESDTTERLWPTIDSSPELLRIGNSQNTQTVVVHRGCSLERALAGVSREAGRSMPPYELQWALNDTFGPLFRERPLSEITQCLQHSRLFISTADHAFMLNIHIDQLGLDEDAICAACHSVLSQSNEIVSSEELIERLEADGKIWDELSPDVLSSVLRCDEQFEEVGHSRFRLRPCKH